VGLVGRPIAETHVPIQNGLGVGAAIGLAFGVYSWAEIAWGEKLAGTPAASLRADRLAGLLRLAAIIGAVGILLAAGSEGMGPVNGEAVYGTLLLVSIALCIGLFTGSRAWLVYAVANLACSRKLLGYGLLPFRLMPFLEDAHRIGLLRAVGPYYQFRHAEFQDHLAAPFIAPLLASLADPAPAPHVGPAPSASRVWGRRVLTVAVVAGGIVSSELLSSFWQWIAGAVVVFLGLLSNVVARLRRRRLGGP
jgi:hypothetical protein